MFFIPTEEIIDPFKVVNPKVVKIESENSNPITFDPDAPVSFGKMSGVIQSFSNFEARAEAINSEPAKKKRPPAPNKSLSHMVPIAGTPEEVPKKKKKSNGKDEEEEVIKDPRESVDFYLDRFKKPIDMVSSIIDELDAKKVSLEEEVNELRAKSQRMSGPVLEYISKQDTNITSLINNKLSAIKELTTIYDKVSNLELKKNNADIKSGVNQQDTGVTMSKLYEKMMGDPNAGSFSMNDLYDSTMSGAVSGMSYDEMVENALDNRYNSLLGDGKVSETHADMNLKYANRRIELRILRSESTDNWRFAAVDLTTEEELMDYALPTVVGKMKFDLDNLIARDNLRTYPVILVPDGFELDNNAEFITDFTTKDDVEDEYYGYHHS